MLALKQAVFREWSTMGDETLLSLRRFLVEYPSTHRNTCVFLDESNASLDVTSLRVPKEVQKQMYRLAVLMLKRGWIAPSLQELPGTAQWRQQFLAQLEGMLKANDMLVILDGLRLARELVLGLKSGDVGLPLAFHLRVKASAEATVLPALASFLLPLLNRFGAAAQDNTPEYLLSEETLDVLQLVFTWPFTTDGLTRGAKDDEEDDDTADLDSCDFCPDAGAATAWRSLLVSKSDVLRLFFMLYGAWRDRNLGLHGVASCLLPLCGVHGEIFSNRDEQLQYVTTLMQGMRGLLGPSEAQFDIVLDTETLARGIVDVARTYAQDVVLQAASSLNFFEDLSQYTDRVMALARTVTDAEDVEDDMALEAIMGAVESMLEAWMHLTRDDEGSTRWVDACGHIYEGYIQTRLATARASMLRDEDSDEDLPTKDRLAYITELETAAAIGRRSPKRACEMLKRMLDETRNSLANADGELQAALHLEQVHWLLLEAGHLIANATEKMHAEDLAAPVEMRLVSQQVSPCPVLSLLSSVFAWVMLENEQTEQGRMDDWSPLLSDTILWFLERWASNYLRPIEPPCPEKLSDALMAAYSPQSEREGVLEFLLRKICYNLLGYRSDGEVTVMTGRLLLAVAKLPFAKPLIPQSPSWQRLADAYVRGDAMIMRLPGDALRGLLSALCVFASSDVQSVRGLCEPLLAFLRPVLLPPRKLTGNDLVRLWSACDMVRGLVKGVSGPSTEVAWELLKEVSPALFAAYQQNGDDHATVTAILQTWNDVAEFLLEGLSPPSQHALLQRTGELITAFQQCGHAGNKTRRDKDGRRQDYAQYQRLAKLHKVLRSIAPYPEQAASAQFTWFGLAVVCSAFANSMDRASLLAYPKLAKSHFQVLFAAIRHHAHALPQIPPFLFSGVLTNLMHALQYFDEEPAILRLALDAIAAFLASMATAQGLSAEKRDAVLDFVSEIHARLLGMHFLDEAAERAAADAYLAGLCLDAPRYLRWADALVSKHAANAEGPLRAAFDALHKTLDSQPRYDRQSRTKFGDVFGQFLVATHGYGQRSRGALTTPASPSR